jgi:hypothetical protein
MNGTKVKSQSSHLNKGVMLRFYDFSSISFRLPYDCWLMTRLTGLWLIHAYPYSNGLLDHRVSFCTITYQVVTCLFVLVVSPFGSCWLPSMYISAPLGALRDSKWVLFCTNTSHRRTWPPFLDLCITILRGIPFYRWNLLRPEQSSYGCDLAIRIATTCNMKSLTTDSPL